MTNKPFSPDDALIKSVELKIANIPDFVIDAVNELLARNFINGTATFNQDDVIVAIQKRQDIERHIIFNKKYLDFEDLFREQGWDVTYHKGAYYETWTPFFVFKSKTK